MVNYCDIQNEIRKMFMCPSLDRGRYDEKFGTGIRPLLFLLRRDLQGQYRREEEDPINDGIKSPLLTCLGIMVGFELLTKLWSGQFEVVRNTSKKFLREILSLDEAQAEALVRFRNAIAHSYSLTDVTRDGTKFRFKVDADDQRASDAIRVVPNGNEKEVYINAWWLKKLFLESVQKYKFKLENDLDLQCKFMVCQRELGRIRIEGDVKSP